MPLQENGIEKEGCITLKGGRGKTNSPKKKYPSSLFRGMFADISSKREEGKGGIAILSEGKIGKF